MYNVPKNNTDILHIPYLYLDNMAAQRTHYHVFEKVALPKKFKIQLHEQFC